MCLAGHEVSENGLETQLNTDENEKQKEKPAADQFFSSLLGDYPQNPLGRVSERIDNVGSVDPSKPHTFN